MPQFFRFFARFKLISQILLLQTRPASRNIKFVRGTGYGVLKNWQALIYERKASLLTMKYAVRDGGSGEGHQPRVAKRAKIKAMFVNF